MILLEVTGISIIIFHTKMESLHFFGKFVLLLPGSEELESCTIDKKQKTGRDSVSEKQKHVLKLCEATTAAKSYNINMFSR